MTINEVEIIGNMKPFKTDERIKKIIKILGIDNFISEMEYWFDKDLIDDFIDSVEDEYSIR
jgi:hypothetical protein